MADSAEDIFGPGVLNVNIDELAASRTQAATTASQTIILARQLIDEHNRDLNAHPETTPKYANSEDPGIVIIDENMSSSLDYAVPNTTAVKNFVGEIVSSALTYAGQLDISDFNTDTQTITINKAVKKGNLFIITGTGSFEYNGHVYSAEDYIIAKSAISSSAEKKFSSFDWFNIQDTDVVKVDKSQYLTNKNLSDDTNVYRNATTQLNGAVVLASSLDDDRTAAVTTSTLVKSKLSEKLSVIDEKIFRHGDIDGSTEMLDGFKPLDKSGLKISHLDTDEIFNLSVISELDSNNTVIRKIFMPSADNYPSIQQTEILATKSYVDNLNVTDILKPNKDVATPVFVNGEYTIFKNDGTTSVAPDSIGITNQNISKTNFEDGYKVSWTGNYKWTHSDSTFDPTRWTYSGFSLNVTTIDGTNLPPSGQASSEQFRLGFNAPVSENASGTIKLFASKSGLVVSGSNIVPATGENEKSATLSIGFVKKFFWGYSTNAIPTANEISAWANGTISAGTTNFSSQRIPTSGVMSDPGNNNSFMFIVYPADMNDLTSIKVTLGSNTSDATSAFVKLTNTVDVTSVATGKTTTYKIYRSTAMSSVTGAYFNIA